MQREEIAINGAASNLIEMPMILWYILVLDLKKTVI